MNEGGLHMTLLDYDNQNRMKLLEHEKWGHSGYYQSYVNHNLLNIQ